MADALLNDAYLCKVFSRFAALAEVPEQPFLSGQTDIEGGADDNVTQVRMAASNGDEILAVVPHAHDQTMLVIKTIGGESTCDELCTDGRMKRAAGQWIVTADGGRQYGVFDGISYHENDALKVSVRRQGLRALVREIMPT